MKNLQNPISAEAYKILQKLMLSKPLTETTRRAIRVRLESILENEEKTFARWREVVKEKLNKTRQRQVQREFQKRIQGLKIVIHMLTPFWDRTTDVPVFVVRKDKKE